MDSVTWDLAPWTNLSGWSIVALVVISLLRGWLVTRRSLQDKDAEIERINTAHAAEMSRTVRERDSWRDTALTKDATIAEQARQLGDAWEAGRTAAAVIAALPKVTGR